MRLLQHDDAGRYSLTDDLVPDDAPPYGILSHTWGPDEVFCAEPAEQHGLRYFWADTCCINKSDSIELQTGINNNVIFRWYRDEKRLPTSPALPSPMRGTTWRLGKGPPGTADGSLVVEYSKSSSRRRRWSSIPKKACFSVTGNPLGRRYSSQGKDER
ncbi:tetratricopeptide repeat domain protein [Apiospora arundinis]